MPATIVTPIVRFAPLTKFARPAMIQASYQISVDNASCAKSIIVKTVDNLINASSVNPDTLFQAVTMFAPCATSPTASTAQLTISAAIVLQDISLLMAPVLLAVMSASALNAK